MHDDERGVHLLPQHSTSPHQPATVCVSNVRDKSRLDVTIDDDDDVSRLDALIDDDDDDVRRLGVS